MNSETSPTLTGNSPLKQVQNNTPEVKKHSFYGNVKKVAYENPWKRKLELAHNEKSNPKPAKRPKVKTRARPRVARPTSKAARSTKLKKKPTKTQKPIPFDVTRCENRDDPKEINVNAEKKKFFRSRTPKITMNALTLDKHKIQLRLGVTLQAHQKVSQNASQGTEIPIQAPIEISADAIQEAPQNEDETGKSVSGNCVSKITTRCGKPQPGWHQSIIDAGQKDFGTKHCGTCNMVYTIRDEDDEHLHVRFHNAPLSAIRFNGWKNERLVREYMDGRVIMILPEDPKRVVQRLEEVLKVVNVDLGFTDCTVINRDFKAFLFVSNKKIIGCTIAEEIDKGYRAIVEGANQTLCCQNESEKAFCGINRVWTHASQRRKKVATRLLECVSGQFYYGHVLAPSQIAFSDPTPDGIRLACKFNSGNSFLVYKLKI